MTREAPSMLTAQNIRSSGDQQTLYQPLAWVTLRFVQFTPSGDVMTAVDVDARYATAQNKPSSGDQHTESQVLTEAAVCGVQVTPSGDVMTRLEPPLATAQKSRSSGDQHTTRQLLATAGDVVQFTPSEDVAALSPPPEASATRQNFLISGAQQTLYQPPLLPTVLGVQVTPSGDVITGFVVFS